MQLGHITRLRPHAPALPPGLIAVGLMLVWAAHGGGYDTDTWYWGALVALALLAATVIGLGASPPRLSRARAVALAAFALYVAWSYLSITWAQSKGDALEGSNRALLYLLLFAVLAVLPWTVESALIALTTFVLGLGVIAVVLLVRLASADHIPQLVLDGRLASPTGYYNATVALFMMDALAATVLAARRELPALLRGILIAVASASLQLSLMGQSRGWLFTLPLVLLAAVAVSRDRLRVTAAAVLPIAAVLLPLHRLLHVFQTNGGPQLNHAAAQAGRASLEICGAIFLTGTLIAWGETRLQPRALSRARKRQIGALVAGLAIATGCVGALIATHGHPIGFVKRQWHGFTNNSAGSSTGTHFGQIGSGRYDFWRVSLDAMLAHPIGGLGQDNFVDYYVRHRRTYEEPRWTHSLEMRLIAHTGLVGFALFATFTGAAMTAALRARRRAGELGGAVAGACVLPLAVWLIHGSLDWFWEMPALSGPALGFLAVAGAITAAEPSTAAERPALGRAQRVAVAAAGTLALLAAVVALGLPYLSVREQNLANDIRQQDPAAALKDLKLASDLDPLSASPGRLGGAIALQTQQFAEAERRFRQAIDREPGGWFAWLGDGLAASKLGDRVRARRDYEVASSINSQQPAVIQALKRVDTQSPLTPAEAFKLLVLVT